MLRGTATRLRHGGSDADVQFCSSLEGLMSQLTREGSAFLWPSQKLGGLVWPAVSAICLSACHLFSAALCLGDRVSLVLSLVLSFVLCCSMLRRQLLHRVSARYGRDSALSMVRFASLGRDSSLSMVPFASLGDSALSMVPFASFGSVRP